MISRRNGWATLYPEQWRRGRIITIYGWCVKVGVVGILVVLVVLAKAVEAFFDVENTGGQQGWLVVAPEVIVVVVSYCGFSG